MKRNKLVLILIGVALVLLLLFITIFTPRLDTDYTHISVLRTHNIRNNTEIEYIDKILSVGLTEVGLDTIYLIVEPIGNQKLEGTDLELAGRIIPGLPGTSQYIMQIEENMSIRDIIKTTAHEIIHIQQYQSGRLKVNRDENGMFTGFATWDGWPNYDVVNMSYHDYPWELDAYDKDDELYDKMIERLYGSLK